MSLKAHFFDKLVPKFGLNETSAMWKHFSIYKLKSNRSDEDLQAEIAKLLDNYPIQYLTGETAFYDLILKVTPAVLIPRPETEELVDWIIQDQKSETDISILDIGTGSGCIIVTLAQHLDCQSAVGIDVSDEALSVAQLNAMSNNVTVQFQTLDILNSDVTKLAKVDILVSNPPYISQTERPEMTQSTLKHEPEIALFGPDYNPLFFYDWIATKGQSILNENGKVYVELNALAHQEIQAIFDNNHWKSEMRKDIYGNWRMLKAWM